MEGTVPKVVATVFRVTGIPQRATLDDLSAALLSEFSDETEITLDTSQTTLCHSCYDDRTQTALIQFTPCPPRRLNNLSNNDTYQIDFGTGCDITIDKDFYGLTQLYPTTGGIQADVVAVCGLNGHAYGSWAGKADHRGQKRMWLRHFLPEDLPHCRTMIYGYNSKLSDHSIHTIPDYTDSFLEELKKARRLEEEKNRPIIFIGHSFGGVIIAQSIVKAKDYDVRHGPLFTSTRATIFFGTPHRGLIVDDILAMVGDDSPRVDLITSLERGSQELKIELKRFINYSTIINLKIVSFKEVEQTRRLAQGPDGRWSRSGSFFTAVESESSVLQLPESIEETLTVEGDHSTLVKFKYKGHTSYTSVIRHLKNFTQESTSIEVDRCLTATSAIVNKSISDLRRILQNSEVDVNKSVRHMGKKTTLLHMAINSGDSIVSLLLKHGADIDAVDGDGLTALQVAATEGQESVVEVLLANKADISAADVDNPSALHLAASSGNDIVVKLLLESGADIEEVDCDGWTALHFAANDGNEKTVEILLKSGIDITAKDYTNKSPLHLAAENGYEKVVELLLEKGADVTELDDRNKSALQLAARNGHEKVVEVILKNGEDITDLAKVIALRIATVRGHEKVVEVLLKGGADMNARHSSNRAALHLAALHGHGKVVQVLLRNGADIAMKAYNDTTALHLAALHGHEKVVEVLLENGVDTTMKTSSDGETALHIAVEKGHEKVVGVLLRGGPDIAATDSSGRTALHFAALYGHERIAGALLGNGVDVTAKDGSGRTALHCAAEYGHEEVVEVFLKNGADTTVKNNNGWTALHCAAEKGHEEVVEALLKGGADSKVRTSRLLRPVHLAALNGHFDVVSILRNL